MCVAWMSVTIVLMPVAAMARTDIVATRYQTCADSTHSNPNIKPASRAPRTKRINS